MSKDKKDHDDLIEIWNLVEGDYTLRLDYDLNEDSVVFDIGGYNGDFSEKIIKKYNPNIFCFEPIREFYNEIAKKNIEKIGAYNFGLGGSTRKDKIFLLDDASSIFDYSDDSENIEIDIVDIYDFIKDNNIKRINLMKINVEGCEYEILNRLISTGLISIIDNIQVQFHNFVEDSKSLKDKISRDLIKTHRLTYQYEFIWENWKIEDL